MSDNGHVASMEQITAAFDSLDTTERLTFSPPEDRQWMWAHRKAGRAEYHEKFQGRADLAEWMRMSLSSIRGGYVPAEIRAPLEQLSLELDRPILDTLGLKISDDDYKLYIGQWSADDYIWANAYPVPERQKPRVILDFGPGYGRQLNLWCQLVPGLRYIGLDVIRKSYLTQSAYFQFFSLPYHEYVIDPTGFRIGHEPGVYHVPGWRWDLVPDGSVDMVLAIMVLPELHRDTVYRTLDQFARVLKPDGALFIRDHGLVFSSANTEDIAKALGERGFVLEFRPHVRTHVELRGVRGEINSDLRGVPRIWRKRHPDTPVADAPTAG